LVLIGFLLVVAAGRNRQDLLLKAIKEG